MSNLLKHAEREFRAAGWTDANGNFEDEMQAAICKHVLDLLKVFSEEGHSGFSAPYTVNLFQKLAMYQPIVPLTGEDWEWMKHDDGCFQNIRCSAVFKQPDRFKGQAYYLNGKVFREPDGRCYTNKDSMVPVTFPYTPETEYVDVPASNAESN